MFRKFMLLAGVVGMISAAGADTIIPGGNVSGTWAAAGSPFLIMGEITVPSGQTLNIEPGVQVIFQGHYKLIVNGLLEAIGTEQDSILFTAANPTIGWWGIRFLGANDSSQVIYCHLSYGKASAPDNGGGAVYCYNSSPEISNSAFISNLSGYRGGAICLENNSNSLISNNLISGNSVGGGSGGTKYGGGIYCEDSNPTLENNLIINNSAIPGGGTSIGGAIYFDFDSPTLINNTICANSAVMGGAISCWGILTMANSIIWNNISTNAQLYVHPASIITYSCIEGDWPGIGNINAPPIFAVGPYGIY